MLPGASRHEAGRTPFADVAVDQRRSAQMSLNLVRRLTPAPEHAEGRLERRSWLPPEQELPLHPRGPADRDQGQVPPVGQRSRARRHRPHPVHLPLPAAPHRRAGIYRHDRTHGRLDRSEVGREPPTRRDPEACRQYHASPCSHGARLLPELHGCPRCRRRLDPRGEPGYSRKLDREGDGIACE
ncbi:excalibur calcium-binding domain-containing protein [Intrasporangium zincisolvens]|uniref:excalibur calcium-binding domain-containing protein n=1 Tax=Intrasporangium zincisolvens TaxID=3080018 RepID=UPI0039B77869